MVESAQIDGTEKLQCQEIVFCEILNSVKFNVKNEIDKLKKYVSIITG